MPQATFSKSTITTTLTEIPTNITTTGLRSASVTTAANKEKPSPLQPRHKKKVGYQSQTKTSKFDPSEVDRSKKVPLLPPPNAHNIIESERTFHSTDHTSSNTLSASSPGHVTCSTTKKQNYPRQIPTIVVKNKITEVNPVLERSKMREGAKYVNVMNNEEAAVGEEVQINGDNRDELEDNVNDIMSTDEVDYENGIDPASTIEISMDSTNGNYTKPVYLPVQIAMSNNVAYKPSCDQQQTNNASNTDILNHAYDEPHSY